MRHIYYSDDNRGTLLSILMIVIGLLLVIWPGHVMTTAMKVLGVALLLGGGILVYKWYRGQLGAADALTLTEGLLLAAAGLIVLAAPGLVISIIPLAVGGMVLLNGILNLAQALDQRRANYPRWTVSMAMAAATVIAGLLVIFNPFSTMEMLVVAIGAISIYNGASNLIIERGYRGLRR